MGNTTSSYETWHMNITWKNERGEEGSGIFIQKGDWRDLTDPFPGGQHMVVQLLKLTYGNIPKGYACV